jgi:hypothetical protein
MLPEYSDFYRGLATASQIHMSAQLTGYISIRTSQR